MTKINGRGEMNNGRMKETMRKKMTAAGAPTQMSMPCKILNL